MVNLDPDAIRHSLGEATAARLADFNVFSEIESTNSFLMQQDGPPAGRLDVAITDNQTMGRGRHGRTWQSPPGSGLCLSLAYTYEAHPENLSALTLAIGLGAIEALEDSGVDGVQLKWPNDLMVGDGKLGGILTESQPQFAGAITIVTGLGLNMDLGELPDRALNLDSTRKVSDLAGVSGELPGPNDLAARLIDRLCATFVDFGSDGFERYVQRWCERDWLFGRNVVIDTQQRQIAGTGAGIDGDGALLVASGTGRVRRITSGSVVLA